AARQRRDPGQSPEQVQREPLAREDRARAPGHARELARAEPFAVLVRGLPFELGIERAEDGLDRRETADHAGLLEQNARHATCAERNNGLGRDVAATEILREPGANRRDVDRRYVHRSSTGSPPGRITV